MIQMENLKQESDQQVRFNASTDVCAATTSTKNHKLNPKIVLKY